MMSLRPLLDIALENERVPALCGRVRDAAPGRGVTLRASATLRPLLIASLLSDDRRAGRASGAPRRSRRSLRPRHGSRSARLPGAAAGPLLPDARDRLRLADQPPPHLVGLRIDALDALSAETDPVVVASAVALAETVPDASLRPAGFSVSRRRGDRPRRTRRGSRRRRLRAGRAGHRAGPVRGPRRHPRRLPGDRGAGGADRAVRRRDRLDALVLDLHPALAGGRRADRAGPGGGARRRAPRSWPQLAPPRSSEGGEAAAEPRRGAPARALPRAARPGRRRGRGDSRRGR